MNNDKNIIFLKGSARYKGANDVGINVEIPLSSTVKEVDEFLVTDFADLATLSEPVNVTVAFDAKFLPVIVVEAFGFKLEALNDIALGPALVSD